MERDILEGQFYFYEFRLFKVVKKSTQDTYEISNGVLTTYATESELVDVDVYTEKVSNKYYNLDERFSKLRINYRDVHKYLVDSWLCIVNKAPNWEECLSKLDSFANDVINHVESRNKVDIQGVKIFL